MNSKETFTLSSILNSSELKECTYELPVILGKTTATNEIVIKDLTELGHVLVGGVSSQGKTSVLHGMITSLLCTKQPTELRLVLIDPKHCEFDKYASVAKDFLAEIPGVFNQILTDCAEATLALKRLCYVMDQRYKELKTAGVRDILEYNSKYMCGDLSKEQGHNFMPYMVIVVDEFGDLIIENGKIAEAPIVQLASVGKRVGIHLIISTQRIIHNVLTGIIKANFPTRMAFRVAAAYESRMIIDIPDAAELNETGILIFNSGNETKRIQGAFVE